MQGSLSEGVLPGLLRDLYVGRRTGLLSFVKGGERRGVRFRKGHIVRAHASVESDRLGETLVRLGLLGPAELATADAAVLEQKKRLGLVLQEMGVMDKERLEEAIAVHVREILLKVFSWREGSYVFEEQDPEAPLDEDITLRVSTGELILEAARRVEDPEVVRHALGDIDRVLALSTDPLLRFQRIALSPADGYVLSRIDGTLSAREILQLIPLLPEETERSLFGLLCTGTIEYLPVPPKAAPAPPEPASRPAPRAPAPPPTPAPPPAPRPAPAAAPPAPPRPSPDSEALRREVLKAQEGLKAKNHFEVLGIPKASSEAQVKDAYFRLAKRYHPDAHHDPALADLKDKLEAVFIRLGEAYEVLRNPRARSSYEADLAARAPRAAAAPAAAAAEKPPEVDPEAEARLAEEAVRKAEKNFASDKIWDAIQLLEPAIPRLPARVKPRAQVLLARCYVKNPHWVKRAEELLERVAREDPRNLEAYLTLGAIYKGGGLRRRALGMFRKVLELKPDHEQAVAEVDALAIEEPAPDEGGGGLLKKLFGKG